MQFKEIEGKSQHLGAINEDCLQTKLVTETAFISQTAANGLSAAREEFSKSCADGSIIPQFAQTVGIGAGLSLLGNSRFKLVGEGLALAMGVPFFADMAKSAAEVVGSGIDTWYNPENYQSNLKTASSSAGHFIYENALGAFGMPSGTVIGHMASKTHLNGLGQGIFKPADATAGGVKEIGCLRHKSYSLDFNVGHSDAIPSRVKSGKSDKASKTAPQEKEHVLLERFELKNRDGEVIFDGQFVNLKAALEDAVQRKISLKGVNLSRRDIRGVNLSKANIEDADFGNALADGADFSGAMADGAYFDFMQANKANFKGMQAEDAMFEGMQAEGADFSHMQATNANFDNMKASKANFSCMQADMASFNEMVANGANFSDMQANKADFTMMVARRAVFNGMQAERASFEMVKANGADFSSMQAKGASFTNMVAEKANFSGMQAEGADFESMRAKGANFSNMQARNACFASVKAKDALFGDMQAEQARFFYMIAQGADFSRANLENASFTNVKVQKANFASANFDHAEVNGTCFAEANLSGVRIESIKGLDKAELELGQIDWEVNMPKHDWRPAELIAEDYYHK